MGPITRFLREGSLDATDIERGKQSECMGMQRLQRNRVVVKLRSDRRDLFCELQAILNRKR